MIYVLYGENESEIKKYISLIIKENKIDTKVTYNYKDDKIEDVIEEASYTDLFGSTKLIILNDSTFLSTDKLTNEDKLLSFIDNPNKSTILILKNDKIDSKKKIVKELNIKAKVIEFKLLNNKNIDKYIMDYFKEKDFSIDTPSIKEISKRLISNTSVIDSELEKLILYKNNSKKVTLTDVEKVITKYESVNVFDLIDSVIRKDKKGIFTKYKKLIDEKIEPIMILTLLSNQFRLLLSVLILSKNTTDDKIASILNEHPYRIEIAKRSIYNIKKEELILIIKKLFITDYNIKTGIMDKYDALNQFFLEL